ncbi:hypothetical protein KZP23_05740 [Echinicola marina]|uniref:hypothetical protein n=1 Tax=Echinicola marina TaxID=2859768 RepID=UPI001CF6C4AE|nr:hypothetical protein [Echinicola marina]UCS94523.1 hypothetical protein KZP23_05740 [Echinicola marina]
MAASAADKDYFSVLSDSLNTLNPDIEVMRENVYPFERNDRNSQFNLESNKEIILIQNGVVRS